ncbi:MAG: ABC transporter ATP-binding protein, partial [Actinomycetota bacterium]
MSYAHWRMIRPDLPDDARLSKALLLRIGGFARPYRKKLLALLAAIAAIALLGAVPPLLYRAVIDEAIVNRRLGLLNLLALAILAVALAGAAAQVAARWVSSRVGEGLIFDLRVALFDHIQRMPIAFFTRTQTGALTSRLTNDLVGGHRIFTETLSSVAQTLFGVAVTLAVMFVLEWRLTSLALVIAPGLILVVRRMRGRLHRLMRQHADVNAALNAQMTERFQVGGALLVKLFGRAARESERFSGYSGRLRDVGVETAVYSRMFHVTFAFVAAVGTAVVYWLGGRMVVGREISLGTIVAFGAYLAQLYTPLTMLANARVELAAALVSFQRVFEVLDFESSIGERMSAADLVDPRGEVEFKRVWLRYPTASAVTIES